MYCLWQLALPRFSNLLVLLVFGASAAGAGYCCWCRVRRLKSLPLDAPPTCSVYLIRFATRSLPTLAIIEQSISLDRHRNRHNDQHNARTLKIFFFRFLVSPIISTYFALKILLSIPYKITNWTETRLLSLYKENIYNIRFWLNRLMINHEHLAASIRSYSKISKNQKSTKHKIQKITKQFSAHKIETEKSYEIPISFALKKINIGKK